MCGIVGEYSIGGGSADLERTKRRNATIFHRGPDEHPDPFHDHPHEQVSYIAEGELILYVKGVGEKKLQKGDLFAMPSGIPHTVKTLSPVVRIIDCFTPLREEFI